ncbi:unnamed protein product [Taenia asiatica]|uniref:Uncharacterized protein n=1 Tax=Taenia asiatica TaxID=60517 RepID=A0A0R3VVI8_TAEAS|nr:unnamed protein product [Taenia asiatica]
MAASVVAKVVADEMELQPEGLAPAVWRAVVKGVAKKVGKAVKEFVVYEAAKGVYDSVSKWVKRHFRR